MQKIYNGIFVLMYIGIVYLREKIFYTLFNNYFMYLDFICEVLSPWTVRTLISASVNYLVNLLYF